MLVVGSLGSAYQHGIVDTGREPHFLFFVAFLLSFGFIRTSAHLIRAQVSWWPGNVSVGGTHIHHLVWGILLLLICGYIGVGIHPADPWRSVVAVGFGIGTGLTLDEFALWLNLKDVRRSRSREPSASRRPRARSAGSVRRPDRAQGRGRWRPPPIAGSCGCAAARSPAGRRSRPRKSATTTIFATARAWIWSA